MRDHYPYTIEAARFLPPPFGFKRSSRRFSLSNVGLKKAALLLGCFKNKKTGQMNTGIKVIYLDRYIAIVHHDLHTLDLALSHSWLCQKEYAQSQLL